MGARGAALQTCLAQQSQTKKKRGCVVMGFIIPRTHGWCGELRWPTFFFTPKTTYKRTLPKAWQKKIKEGTKERCTKKKPPHEILCQSPLLFFLITMQYINRVLKIYVNVHQKWFMKGERKHQITENQFFRVSTGLLNVEG
jgi:hypothetical protein